ncbi:MAG: hypothetical protein A3F12_04765 [Gammaproteobacteria bacterium RIFCSPHIGHO2_12_FULL_38_14]|nr:MAG: hypothetical protein A3F12_04765 [Gammaproteobacteria bacterium RIFCSPHIGHO2_12_FULL_38_14]
MDKKIKHRILGILVISGLVIIALPLFQNDNESKPVTALLVQSPSFPEQTVAMTDQQNIPSESIQSAHLAQETPVQNTIPVASTPQINPQYKKVEAKKDDALMLDQAKTTAESLTASMNHLLKNDIENIQQKNTAKQKLNRKSVAHRTVVSAPSTIKNKKMVVSNNELARLNQAAWIIQLGTFKTKSNALRLVNQLRAKGYQAFIQQVSTTWGSRTRVFVGPQIKQSEAFTLADQLENEIHIRGIVISYQPLNL